MYVKRNIQESSQIIVAVEKQCYILVCVQVFLTDHKTKLDT
jgi:hypothetical protein